MKETYDFTFVLITMAKFVAFGTPKLDAIKGDKTLLLSRTKNNLDGRQRLSFNK